MWQKACFIILGDKQQSSLVADSLQPPRTAAHQASLSFTISQSLLKLMSIVSVTPSSHLTLCWPLLLLPSIFPSIRLFPMSQFFISSGQSVGVSASASVSSNEYSGLISFSIDWLELLAIQGTLKSMNCIFNINLILLCLSIYLSGSKPFLSK